jgi:hypothetical protein
MAFGERFVHAPRVNAACAPFVVFVVTLRRKSASSSVKTEVFSAGRIRRHERHASALADDLRQVTRGTFAMKRYTSIVIGAGLLAATSLANAAGQLAPVKVQGSSTQSISTECAPPNDSKDCADFHALIRKNFSTREIGMLFGAPTAYQEYRTSNDRTRAKYAAFVRDIDENGLAAVMAANGAIAVK